MQNYRPVHSSESWGWDGEQGSEKAQISQMNSAGAMWLTVNLDVYVLVGGVWVMEKNYKTKSLSCHSSNTRKHTGHTEELKAALKRPPGK